MIRSLLVCREAHEFKWERQRSTDENITKGVKKKILVAFTSHAGPLFGLKRKSLVLITKPCVMVVSDHSAPHPHCEIHQR
jgi:hypothetical protein